MDTQNNLLKYQIAKLKLVLILLTIVQISAILTGLVDYKFWTHLDLRYNTSWLVWGFHYSTVGILLWYNWKKIPFDKKTKINHTFMILFLGIIGMWLWLPNSRELEKLLDDKN